MVGLPKKYDYRSFTINRTTAPVFELQRQSHDLTTAITRHVNSALAIEGIPLNSDNIRLLHELPLRHLECDLTPPALALLHTHTMLQGMNQHTVSHLSEIGETLYRALRGLEATTGHDHRRGTCAGDPGFTAICRALRSACLSGCANTPDADRGRVLQPGLWGEVHPVCPATAKQYDALLSYITTVIYPGCEPQYHLGLTTDPDIGTFRWLSAAPYQWHHWYTAKNVYGKRSGLRQNAARIAVEGIPYFRSPLTKNLQRAGGGIQIRMPGITSSSNGTRLPPVTLAKVLFGAHGAPNDNMLKFQVVTLSESRPCSRALTVGGFAVSR